MCSVTKYDEMESILIMLLKGSEFIKTIDVGSGMDSNIENKNVFEDYPILLEHYTKYYNDIQYVPYKEIEELYTYSLGEIISKHSNELFKKTVYDYARENRANGNSLLRSFVHAVRYLEMKNVILNDTLNKTLKGKFIKDERN